jgi:ferredoxin
VAGAIIRVPEGVEQANREFLQTLTAKEELTMSDDAVYRDFLEWLNQTWYKLTEADALMPVLKARYTPEEAALLTGMPWSTKTIGELAALKQMDPAELEPKMDEMARKGLVWRRVKDGEVGYRLNDAFFVYMRSAFWRGSTDETTRKLAPLTNKYYYDGFFDQWADVHRKGLRTVPIHETVVDTRRVLPFDDVVKIVNDREYWSVTSCGCRHRKNIDPDSPDCAYPDRVCLHFDTLGRYTVENGLGREITREQTLDILRESAEAGLVHGASNWQDRVDTICNCCKCCCMWLEAYHKLNHSKGLDPSNYRARVDVGKCKGCGLCAKRCPMDALHVEESPEATNKTGKVAVLDGDLCIGCGVCAFKCPGEALLLGQIEEVLEPPKNPAEYIMLYLADRQAADARREQPRTE